MDVASTPTPGLIYLAEKTPRISDVPSLKKAAVACSFSTSRLTCADGRALTLDARRIAGECPRRLAFELARQAQRVVPPSASPASWHVPGRCHLVPVVVLSGCAAGFASLGHLQAPALVLPGQAMVYLREMA